MRHFDAMRVLVFISRMVLYFKGPFNASAVQAEWLYGTTFVKIFNILKRHLKTNIFKQMFFF